MTDVHLSKSPTSLFELTGKAIALLAALGGSLYIMGWSYANTTFRLWGIPLVSLNIPRDHFFSFGVVAIQNELLWLLVVSLIVLGGAVFVHLRWFRNRSFEAALWAVLALCAFLFLLSSYFGKWSAQHSYEVQRRGGFIDLHRAIVLMNKDWLESDNSGRTSHLRRELELGCYRVVFVGSETLWMARPYNGIDTSPSAEPPAVVGLPTKSIAAIRVMKDRENCD